MSFEKPVIGITMGDPAGIGPEILSKALRQDETAQMADFLIIGDRSVYDRYDGPVGKTLRFRDLQKIDPAQLVIGADNAYGGRAAYAYLQEAVRLLKSGEIQGLATAPLSKSAIMAAGIDNFTGHTEMLARAFDVSEYEMMFAGGPFKTIIATRHIPLRDVPQAVTADKLFSTIRLADKTLRSIFKISAPRIALCGINPHAGEGGKIGDDEKHAVIPAVERARREGINAEGPFAADTLFIPANAQNYDLVIAMYHDQGLAPIKALYFTQLVNLTIGLPFIRTSTAHGTAFNIAGQDRADPSSMIAAVRMAVELTEKRIDTGEQ
ncbi:MAG: 4-hydroxythreonine-4-phosphate dehydrogenase PdxA [Candidatus Omnitrophota bacterium]